jgi:radical SAM superfamily enzyme YgiQ (UPF0313 family)
MIILVNPRATRPKNRRFPLSVLAIGAALPEGTAWEIVDGNRPDIDPFAEIASLIDAQSNTRDPVRAIALTVMPGPQLTNAVPLSRQLKVRYPQIPIIWGGYFPSLYPAPVLRAPYVDWIVRGQGEQTFNELLDVIDGKRDPRTVAGLGFREDDTHVINPERRWVGPDELPAIPYHKIPVADYLQPTFLGQRSGVYHASIGCPYGCKFCGVISMLGSREKMQQPERTARDLAFLVNEHGMDSMHFYDNNFFVREDHALELCERITPLGLSWWCEARIDALLRFNDRTWRALARAGLRMVFLGAESGSDEVLRKMDKKLTTAQTLEIAAKTREHGIIPEFSFVLGDPDEPELELENTLNFIRRLKVINPAMELITYFYTPTPQRRGTYGNVDALAGTPDTLEEWVTPEWVAWMTHEDPHVPWMTDRLKARMDDFALVMSSRYPSVHDYRTRAWGKVVGRWLAMRRWQTGRYHRPTLLRAVRRWARSQDDAQAYGHLRAGRSSPGRVA